MAVGGVFKHNTKNVNVMRSTMRSVWLCSTMSADWPAIAKGFGSYTRRDIRLSAEITFGNRSNRWEGPALFLTDSEH